LADLLQALRKEFYKELNIRARPEDLISKKVAELVDHISGLPAERIHIKASEVMAEEAEERHGA
jgi:hypothetical protein